MMKDENREKLIEAAKNLGLGDVSSLSTEEIYKKYQESEHYKKPTPLENIKDTLSILLGGTVMGVGLLIPFLFVGVGFFGLDYLILRVLGISLHPLFTVIILFALEYVLVLGNRFINKTLVERHGEKFGLFGYGDRIKQSFDMFMLKFLITGTNLAIIGMGIYNIVKHFL